MEDIKFIFEQTLEIDKIKNKREKFKNDDNVYF